MKNRRFTDLYLPKPIAYHVKIVVGSLLITMFFSFIWTGKMINESFWFMFFSVIVQLEIFMWIALRSFWGSLITFIVIILSVMAAMGAPAMRDFIRNNRVQAHALRLANHVQLARSEASKRGQAITICPSDNITAPDPADLSC